MKAIILAAGYATRLFPLTKNFPKPLISIAGKPMINYIMEKIEEIGVTDVYVVTNNKFASHFEDWKNTYSGKSTITVVNDQTTSNDDRLGAIGDIRYVLEQENINDDLLIMGGDNIFEFSLEKAHALFEEKQDNVIVGYDVKDTQLAKQYGVIEIDSDSKIISFEEKPAEPKSTVCAICVYLYPKKTLPLLETYIGEGNNPDQPGRFAAWLVENHTVYGQQYSEPWYDVGGFESLKEAKEQYGEENVDIEELKKEQS